jgi:alpha-ketoglutarate-dependent taurine dioxygenase
MIDTHQRRKPQSDRLRSIQPKTMGLSEESLVTAARLSPEEPLPLLVQPAVAGLDLASWLRDHLELAENWLREHGGVLFRGFAIDSVAAFGRFTAAIGSELLEYKERSTPRTRLEGRIYTSTEYPAHQSIAFHNEFSYSLTWPLKIVFCCLRPADQGGETPIADSRQVYRRLEPGIRERFERDGVMYVRNYGGGVDLSWQEAFQTSDRAAVEEYCRQAPMEHEWRGADRLRTRAVRPAVARHPRTGETLWFNQAHLFHLTNLEPAVRQAMLDAFGEEDLPRNTFYGDGAPIAAGDLDAVRDAYAAAAVSFPWQRGDLLLLDNMLVAHGRKPFAGERSIVVAMMEPHHPQS